MPLPSTTALRCFLAATTTGSFTAAATQLHLTHGAVSRQVAQLEQLLGVQLFERRRQRIHLTPVGKSYAESVAPLLATLEKTTQQIQIRGKRHVRRNLVISCEPTLAMRWLIPRLPLFNTQHAQTTVRVLAAGGAIDLRRSEADIAIRREDFPVSPDLHATRLMAEYIGPVVRPGTADWPSQPRLHTETRLSAWDHWQAISNHGPSEATVPESRFEHFYLSLQAATAGLGAAMAAYPMVMDDLRTGMLNAPAGFVATPIHYLALTTQEAHDRPEITQLLTWLEAQAQLAIPAN